MAMLTISSLQQLEVKLDVAVLKIHLLISRATPCHMVVTIGRKTPKPATIMQPFNSYLVFVGTNSR